MSATSSAILLTAAGDDSGCSASCSCSGIIGKVDARCYQIPVLGYSTSRRVKTGDYMKSSMLTVGGQSWRVEYYPNGCSAKANGDMSILLTRVGSEEDGPVCAAVRLDLIVQAGGESAVMHGGMFNHTFGPNDSFGYPRFISTDELEKSAYLKDDSFTILCGIVVQGPPFEVAVPPSNLHWNIGDLLGDTEGADVSFDVGGETFPVHRLVLAARSLVFKAQLLDPLRGKGPMHIHDMHADVFRALLHFIYTDRLPSNVYYGGEEGCTVAAIMAQHMLVAVDKYDLPRLKLICENNLSRCLTVSTVATTLALAEQHSVQRLKGVVLRFLMVSSNMAAVRCTDDYKNLLESCPYLREKLTSRGILP